MVEATGERPDDVPVPIVEYQSKVVAELAAQVCVPLVCTLSNIDNALYENASFDDMLALKPGLKNVSCCWSSR